jgi:hypothetical protein
VPARIGYRAGRYEQPRELMMGALTGVRDATKARALGDSVAVDND